MNLLLLGGLSLHNKEWIYGVEKALAPLFKMCVVHEYAHWEDPQKTMDLDAELAAAANKASELGEYAIFAKSIGSVVALKGIGHGLLSPKACLFAGLPLGAIKNENIDLLPWVQANKAPSTIVQNSQDPTGSFIEIEEFLSNLPANYKLVELPGDTHSYNDLPKLKELFAALV